MFGLIFAVTDKEIGKSRVCARAIDLLISLRGSDGGLDLLVLHTKPVISILLAACKEAIHDNDINHQCTLTVVAMAAHTGESQLLRENVLSLVHHLVTTRSSDQVRCVPILLDCPTTLN